jgi:phenylacetate-CoA ligase
MVYKFIFKIGQQFRNPSLQKWFQFLKKTESWTLEELEFYQLKKIQELVAVAYSKSEFYKNKFDNAGVKPTDIKTLADIKKIPLLTKKELLNFTKSVHTTLTFKKQFVATTSGTTGDSLSFHRDESADSFNRAVFFRGYSWFGVNPWDRNGYFWGFNFTHFEKFKTHLLDFLQNRFRLFSYHKKDLNLFIKKLTNATYIHGYSSMIYESAKMINKQVVPKPSKLKMVKGTSEKIYESYQSEIKKAFGLKMISEYGAVESGIIAFECPFGTMHITMEGVFVEEVENEIVVTNLQMQSFPIIRYKLGDYIQLESKEKKCKCGMQHAIIKEVTGRIGAVVYGFTKTYPSLYFYYIFKNISKKHDLNVTYQVKQEKKGHLLFLIEQALNQKEKKYIEKEVYNYFNDDMQYVVLTNQNFVPSNQKLKSFITNIT